MNIEKTLTEGLKNDFKVTLPWGTIAEKVDQWLTEKAKGVRLDGFRPGKVPMNVVRQRYEAQATEEVIERGIQEATRKILDENNLRPVVQPQLNVEQIDPAQDVIFSVSVETLPEIALKEFKELKLEKLVVEISDKEVDETLKKVAENYQKFKPAADTHKIKEGNRVTADLTCEVNGKVCKPYSGKDVLLFVGKKELGLDFIEEKLVGHKKGEELSIEHTFGNDHQDKAVAGKNAIYKVKIKEVAEAEKFKLSDELAKELGFENIEELRVRVRENLQKDQDQTAKLYHKRHVLDALEATYKFDLPESMVKAEFELIWTRLQEEMARAKANGTLDAEDAAKDNKELEKEYRGIAERRVRLGLVIAEVAKKHNIRINPELVRSLIVREAMNYPGQENEVVAFYRKHPQAIERLTSPVLEDMVVDFIFMQSTLQEKKLTVEELKEKMKSILPAEETEEETSQETKKSAKLKRSKKTEASEAA